MCGVYVCGVYVCGAYVCVFISLGRMLPRPLQAHCMEKEAKMQKEVVKGAKDPELSRERLKQLQDSTKLAEAEGVP